MAGVGRRTTVPCATFIVPSSTPAAFRFSRAPTIAALQAPHVYETLLFNGSTESSSFLTSLHVETFPECSQVPWHSKVSRPLRPVAAGPAACPPAPHTRREGASEGGAIARREKRRRSRQVRQAKYDRPGPQTVVSGGDRQPFGTHCVCDESLHAHRSLHLSNSNVPGCVSLVFYSPSTTILTWPSS